MVLGALDNGEHLAGTYAICILQVQCVEGAGLSICTLRHYLLHALFAPGWLCGRSDASDTQTPKGEVHLGGWGDIREFSRKGT